MPNCQNLPFWVTYPTYELLEALPNCLELPTNCRPNCHTNCHCMAVRVASAVRLMTRDWHAREI